ncbi:hypothetical protein [Levilactobacillus fujinensis]|uniref:Uncharacterized protein n=1 Tax=Levilactobacillus fujinensis TaxID=2486024 RepID=A0ABW1TD17_9LACO|nr:hypothetical protein [Levilactobacillus fujinensis]
MTYSRWWRVNCDFNALLIKLADAMEAVPDRPGMVDMAPVLLPQYHGADYSKYGHESSIIIVCIAVT